ncbi:MAG TPA: hypothetical protein VE961_14255, partial [Pyrinomonadaceae bacterium]|nr:hypothetical protein [Pyrinomonadaceae bacterium]
MPVQLIDNIRRSNFSLPAFQRISWVSDQARAVWEPRLQSIQGARSRNFALATRKQTLPECCRAFRLRMRDDRKLLDVQFAQSLNTGSAIIQDRVVQIFSPGIMNTLPARLDVLPFAHEPCSMDCQASRAMAEAWVKTGRANGFREAMDDLETLLSWPMEWSRLHGIAELKLPILKLVANTDATAQAYRVQILSDNYPDEGVSGLNFPFARPHAAKVSDSKSFKDGLAHPIVKLNGRQPRSSQNAVADMVARQQSVAQAILPAKPRSSFILDETLTRLRMRLPTAALSIEAIFLGNPFNVIRLSDGSTGACMNYFRFKSGTAAEKTTEGLVARLPGDPLLTRYLNEGNEPDLLQLSLKTCLVSALSRKLLE